MNAADFVCAIVYVLTLTLILTSQQRIERMGHVAVSFFRKEEMEKGSRRTRNDAI